MTETEKYRPWLFKLPPGGVVGKRRVPRKDGYEKASGKALYTRDVYLPGMLYAKFYLSPYVHAKIRKLDTRKAEALPGVAAVLRYDDPTINWEIIPPAHGSRAFMHNADERNQSVLQNPVNYYRQPCAALVVADSEATCDRALRLLEIKWEELPFIMDAEEALKPGAHVLRPDMNPKDNTDREGVEQQGNIEDGFAEADKVIEFRVTGEEQVWAGVEGQVQVAEWKGDYLNAWHHNQTSVDENLASYFEMDRSKINVHMPYNGALFGALVWVGTPHRYAIVASIAAKKTGRPVKLLMDESHFLGSEETCGVWEFKVGFKKDGTITAASVRSIWNTSDLMSLRKIAESTKIPHLYNKISIPFVNRGPIVCSRHGGPATMIHHQIFSHVAAELNMDPIELALKNDGIGEGRDMHHANEIKREVGMDPTRDSLKECIEIGKKAIDWEKNYHAPGTRRLLNGRMHGISFNWILGWFHRGGSGVRAALMVQSDGSIEIMGRHGDGGWCGETTYCQVVADEVGLKYENVTLRPFDFKGFDLQAGGGSFGCMRNVEPLVLVSRELKRTILEAAVKPGRAQVSFFSFSKPDRRPIPPIFPDKKPEHLDIKDGMVFEKANRSNKATIAKVLSNVYGRSHFPFVVSTQPPSITDEQPALVRQCYFMEVEVDTATGMTYVTKLVIVNDVGKILNPDACEGQQYSVYMGLGSSFREAVYFDPQTGVKLNDNLIGYAVPVMNDFGSIEAHLIETGLGFGPYGMVGIGESNTACTRPMAGPAIYNAIGKWIDDYPITPDKVLKAIGKI